MPLDNPNRYKQPKTTQRKIRPSRISKGNPSVGSIHAGRKSEKGVSPGRVSKSNVHSGKSVGDRSVKGGRKSEKRIHKGRRVYP